MEHQIKDGDVIRLADLLDWYENGTLRQSRSAGQIWVTVHFTKQSQKPETPVRDPEAEARALAEKIKLPTSHRGKN